MKKIYLLFLGAILLLGCNSTKNMMSSEWSKPDYSPKKLSKIAVIVVSDDHEVRREGERALAKNLNENGLQAVDGTKFLPLNSPEKDWKAENIASKLKQNNFDGVMVLSLVNTRDRQVYNQGENVVYPNGFVRVGRYVYRTYGQVQTPGYYTTEKEYVIESSLYDLNESTTNKEDALIWSGQSKVGSYSSLRQASNSYGKRLTKYLMESNIIL